MVKSPPKRRTTPGWLEIWTQTSPRYFVRVCIQVASPTSREHVSRCQQPRHEVVHRSSKKERQSVYQTHRATGTGVVGHHPRHYHHYRTVAAPCVTKRICLFPTSLTMRRPVYRSVRPRQVLRKPWTIFCGELLIGTLRSKAAARSPLGPSKQVGRRV